MPSNLAFSQLRAGEEYADLLDMAAKTEMGYGGVVEDVGGISRTRKGISPRTLMMNIRYLKALGVPIDMQSREMQAIEIWVMTNYSLMMLYKGVKLAMKAYQARLAVRAAAETAANATNPYGWAKIALAASAVALFYGSMMISQRLASGEWNFPSFDFESPQERRIATRRVANAVQRRG